VAIRFRCSQCNKPLSIATRKAGTQITCPICQAALTVPAVSAAPVKAVSEVSSGIPVSNAAFESPAAFDFAASATPAPSGQNRIMLLPSSDPALAADVKSIEPSSSDPVDNTWRTVAIVGAFATILLATLITALILFGNSGDEPSQPILAQNVHFSPPTTSPVAPLAKKDVSAKPKIDGRKSGEVPQVSKDPEPPKFEPKKEELFRKEFEFPKREPKFEFEPKKPVVINDLSPKGGPALLMDNFGNPKGPDAGLARDMEFKGKRLLIWSGCPTEFPYIQSRDNPLWKALEAKGFTLKVIGGRFQPEWLKDTDQFWLFSSNVAAMDEAGYKAVEKFARDGNGLYLLADNHPYLVEANVLTQRMFDTSITGDYPGQQIAYVKQRNLSKTDIQKFGGQYPIDDHALLTGVNFLYEGITISHLKPSKKLEVAVRASDGNILVAFAKDRKLRVVIDCGFTRYYYGGGGQDFVTRTAGTIRFGENMAAFLMGKDR
jgi:hypothetical protein